MSNYNLSKELIRKINDVYNINYLQFLKLLEIHKTDKFLTEYVYPKIIQNENESIVELGDVLSFNVSELDFIFNRDCDLKLELYKIMVLKEKLYQVDGIKRKRDASYKLKSNINRRFGDFFIIKITFTIISYTGFYKYIKKDKKYTYLHLDREPYHFKNIYDFLLTSFEELDIECSEEYIKNLNKEEFDNLMSLFDMKFI